MKNITLLDIYQRNGFPPKCYIVTSGKEITRCFDNYEDARKFALTLCFGGTMVMPNGDTLAIPKTGDKQDVLL